VRSAREEEHLPVISTLFLDAGGVLVNPNWERVGAALERHGVAATAARLAAAEPLAKRDLDSEARIVSTTDQSRSWLYFDSVLTHAGIPLSEATDAALAELREYHARHNLWECVPEEVVPCLRRFRAMGLRLVVISNANGTLRDHFRRLGLDAYVDDLLDSHDEGVEKPDPRIFEVALERSGARRESTVHVGDFYHVDVVGARAAGLRAVLLDTAGLYEGVDCPRVSSLTELAHTVLR
jgi:putative hydrolase of the HAD superfamily